MTERALEIKPGYLQAHYNLGLLYFTRGVTEKAAAHLKKIIEIDPSSALARHVLARVFERQNGYSVLSEYSEK
jgi:Tfp pilus assembly protein PilF